MDQEEIEIIIGADGQVTVQTHGIKGPRCLDVAEAVARLIGREESRQLTDEFYEAEIRTHAHAQQEQRVRFEID